MMHDAPTNEDSDRGPGLVDCKTGTWQVLRTTKELRRSLPGGIEVTGREHGGEMQPRSRCLAKHRPPPRADKYNVGRCTHQSILSER